MLSSLVVGGDDILGELKEPARRRRASRLQESTGFGMERGSASAVHISWRGWAVRLGGSAAQRASGQPAPRAFSMRLEIRILVFYFTSGKHLGGPRGIGK